MKTMFENPEIEVEKLNVEDVITTSTGEEEEEEGWGGGRV